jgi:Uma2 family endonuclease
MIVRTPTKTGEPTWDIAYLFPNQGYWSEEEYLSLESNHLIEFSQGHLEFLSMPTQSHQIIVLHLYRLLLAYVEKHNLGMVLIAPLRIKLWDGKFREPNIVFMKQENADRRGEKFWEGADLVVEVVSGSAEDRERDLTTKRQEYAEAGIPEYWIVDPKTAVVHVLVLANNEYLLHGRFETGQTATSVLLPGFVADVEPIFATANK